MPSRRDTFRIAVRKFGPFESAIQKQWASFCAATGCTLRIEAEPLDLHPLHDTLFARQGLKNGNWDAAFVVTDWIAEAHATHALLDLTPFLSTRPPDNYPHGWTDSLLRFQRFDHAVLALPYHDGPECLIYRKDLFDAAGLAPPKTWDEFHATARALTKSSANQYGTVFAAYPDGHNTVYDFCLQLWTRGGELFDSAGRLHLATPAAEAALAFYREILTDSSATHPRSRELDSVQSGFAFARGEVAMMVNWFGFAAMGESLPESTVKGKIAVAPLPSAPGCASASLNVYWTLGIGSGSPHPKIAYDFLRHCATAENDKLLTLEGAIGCRKSTWHDTDVNRVIPFYRELETIHAHARELPRLAHWSELSSVIDRLVTSAADTEEPLRNLLLRAQQEANALTA
jgi:multiple sugar transport system substrate-binding protein